MRSLIFGLVGMTCLGSIEIGYAQYFALTNLDMRGVEFVLTPSGTGDAEHNRLYDRAVQRLSEAGLYHPHPRSSGSEMKPTLELTLEVIDLGKAGLLPLLGNTCPDKWLYMKKIELWDYVYTKGNPGTPVLALIWTRFTPLPVIGEKVPIDRLEADLDRMLGQFIADYQQGNQPKK